MEELNEIDFLISEIKSIAYHISNHNDCSNTSSELSDGLHIKMDDLSYKLNQLKNIIYIEKNQPYTNKPHVNVAIISILDVELNALDKVFNFKINPPDVLRNGLKVWNSKITQDKNGKELSLIFTMIGRSGNLPSFYITDLLLKSYDIDLIILSGIAAGDEEEIKIYSSIIGETIIYYEPVKTKANKKTDDRFDPIKIDYNFGNQIRHLDQKRWKQKFNEILKIHHLNISPIDIQTQNIIKNNWKDDIIIKIGAGIYSGEKLLADGTFFKEKKKKNQIGKEVLAGEMEGFGFAFACTIQTPFAQIKWLVIRGISDYGDPNKKNKLIEKHQIIAGISSAVTIYEFLVFHYTE